LSVSTTTFHPDSWEYVALSRRNNLMHQQRRRIGRRRRDLHVRLGGTSGVGLCRHPGCRQGEHLPTC
jgi:hypothetical protein